jgi:hypothetical protein
MKDIKKLSNDELLEEFMDWTRIYRNEGQLLGNERDYYKSLVKEIKLRELLNMEEIYHAPI